MKLPLLQDMLMLPRRAKMHHALKLNRWPLIDYVKQARDEKKGKKMSVKLESKVFIPTKIMAWSDKYKKSIDCDNPKGFSQKAHCAGRRKKAKELAGKSKQSRMNK